MTLRAQPVAEAEALALLLSWSTLSGNKALLDHVRNLCEKHNVKELTGERRLLEYLVSNEANGNKNAIETQDQKKKKREGEGSRISTFAHKLWASYQS